jgi:acetyl-CoA synthetase
MTERSEGIIRQSAFQLFRAARDLLMDCYDDYNRAYRRFRWPRPEYFNWASDWFDRIAEGNAGVALRVIGAEGDRSVTFAGLSKRSDQVAAWLAAEGIGPGDRVLVLADNVAELWELQLALMKLRTGIVPVFTTLAVDDIGERAQRAGAQHIVAMAPVARRLPFASAAKVRVSIGGDVPGWLSYNDSLRCTEAFTGVGPTPADEPLFYFFTSGTTARPKLVVHSHVSYAIGHLSSMYLHRLRPGDVHLNVSAPGWAKHPWSSFYAPWNAEATIVSMETWAAHPAGILAALRRVRADSFCAPPSVWRRLLATDLESCAARPREALSVGEPLTMDIVRRVRDAWGVTVRNGYGQSEVTAIAGVVDAAADDPTLLGRPLPGYRLTLREVGSDKPVTMGEICVDLSERPAGMMRGYLDETGPNATVGQGALYRTGDLARCRDDGSLVFLGRVKDAFVDAGGARVIPVELERALIGHPAVAEVAVVPVDDGAGGLAAKAYVRLAQGWNAADATALCVFDHLVDRQAHGLELLEFIDVFPRTESGKIHRELLRSFVRSAQQEFRTPPAP